MEKSIFRSEKIFHLFKIESDVGSMLISCDTHWHIHSSDKLWWVERHGEPGDESNSDIKFSFTSAPDKWVRKHVHSQIMLETRRVFEVASVLRKHHCYVIKQSSGNCVLIVMKYALMEYFMKYRMSSFLRASQHRPWILENIFFYFSDFGCSGWRVIKWS